jgi:hypothetical protein
MRADFTGRIDEQNWPISEQVLAEVVVCAGERFEAAAGWKMGYRGPTKARRVTPM